MQLQCVLSLIYLLFCLYIYFLYEASFVSSWKGTKNRTQDSFGCKYRNRGTDKSLVTAVSKAFFTSSGFVLFCSTNSMIFLDFFHDLFKFSMTLGSVVTSKNFHNFPSLGVFFDLKQFNRHILWCLPK